MECSQKYLSGTYSRLLCLNVLKMITKNAQTTNISWAIYVRNKYSLYMNHSKLYTPTTWV